MKHSYFPGICMIIICVPLLLSLSVCKARQKSYISQVVVDSTVQRALYLMNEASSVAGVGFREREAIEAAKATAQKLKAMARNDPNEKYVLFKVNELEAQIYLEEKDLLAQQGQKLTGSANDLVKQYNNEVGKPRPDFTVLKSIYDQMGHVDVHKSNEIAGSFNSRYRQISREVVFSIEKSLMEGDNPKAQTEFDYCLKNRKYLTISSSKIDQISERLQALTRAELQIPAIRSLSDKAERSLAKMRLAEARKSAESALTTLNSIKKDLSLQEWTTLSTKINTVLSATEHSEDSLVHTALELLNLKGIKAASEYLNSLKSKGLPQQKIATIDNAILAITVPGKSSKISTEISSVSTEPEEDNIFDKMRVTAVKKAKEKSDSIRLAEEERIRLSRKEQDYKDSLQLVAQRKAERASQISIDLYTLLEQNKLEQAWATFSKEREFLRIYLWSNAYQMLELTVSQARETLDKEIRATWYVSGFSKTAVGNRNEKTLNLDDEHTARKCAEAQDIITQIYTQLEKKEIREAYNNFKKHKRALAKYVHKDAFAMIESSVSQAYDFYKSSNQ